jgi:hypothetical protein
LQRAGNHLGRWHHLLDQLDVLARHLAGSARHAGDVPARPGKALDKACSKRIANPGHHDRNVARGAARRRYGRRLPADDQVDLLAHEIRRKVRQVLQASACRPEIEADVLAVDITQLAEGLAELSVEDFRIRIPKNQNPYSGRLGGLSLRTERRGRCGAAETREKGPPSHESTPIRSCMRRRPASFPSADE